MFKLFGRTTAQEQVEEVNRKYAQSQFNKYMNESRKTKMTREEARKIVFDKCKFLEGRESGYLVEVLEALGLIKFDKSEIDELAIFDTLNIKRIVTLSEMQKVLNLAGYDIYRTR